MSQTMVLDIVKITGVTKKEHELYINKIAVIYDDIQDDNQSNELLFRFIDNKEYVSFYSGQISYDKIGYIENESKEKVQLNYVDLLFQYPHHFIAQNTKNPIMFAGNVSRVGVLTYLQLNENFVLGYVGTREDDPLATSKYPNAELYFFVKIGEIDNTSIYRYSSDMFIRDEIKEISWVLGFGNKKVYSPIILEETNVIKTTQFLKDVELPDSHEIYSTSFAALNTKRNISLVAPVERRNYLTYLELNEHFAIGYVGSRHDDSSSSKTYKDSMIYFFIKVSEVNDEPIYLPVSEISINDKNQEIYWKSLQGDIKVTDPKLSNHIDINQIVQYAK